MMYTCFNYMETIQDILLSFLKKAEKKAGKESILSNTFLYTQMQTLE